MMAAARMLERAVCIRPVNTTVPNGCRHQGYKKAINALKASVLLVALSGCASKPEIAVNSYCEIKPTELIDMRDPGLQRLTPANQGAVLTGDDNYKRFCAGGKTDFGGPR